MFKQAIQNVIIYINYLKNGIPLQKNNVDIGTGIIAF